MVATSTALASSSKLSNASVLNVMRSPVWAQTPSLEWTPAWCCANLEREEGEKREERRERERERTERERREREREKEKEKEKEKEREKERQSTKRDTKKRRNNMNKQQTVLPKVSVDPFHKKEHHHPHHPHHPHPTWLF